MKCVQRLCWKTVQEGVGVKESLESISAQATADKLGEPCPRHALGRVCFSVHTGRCHCRPLTSCLGRCLRGELLITPTGYTPWRKLPSACARSTETGSAPRQVLENAISWERVELVIGCVQMPPQVAGSTLRGP